MFSLRYWFPFYKTYFESFMINCEVCQINSIKKKKNRKVIPSKQTYEENPLDKI
jgi:hypothetical protein